MQNATLAWTMAAVMMLLPLAAADHECETEESAIPVSAAGETFYVVNDPCQPVVGDGTCTFSVWVFQESNGQPGLQRDDEFGEQHCEGDKIIL